MPRTFAALKQIERRTRRWENWAARRWKHAVFGRPDIWDAYVISCDTARARRSLAEKMESALRQMIVINGTSLRYDAEGYKLIEDALIQHFESGTKEKPRR